MAGLRIGFENQTDRLDDGLINWRGNSTLGVANQ
jgi:hypothetical protein